MKTIYIIDLGKPRDISRTLLSILLFLGISLSSCTAINVRQDPSARETLIERNVQQTIAAQQPSQKLTIVPTSLVESTNTPVIIPTQALTITPGITEETTTPSEELDSTLEVTENPLMVHPGDFESWMKTANILIYEDIVNNPNTNRYVKDTLKNMGIECSQKGDLACKDDGSAQGWFREDLQKGSLDGNSWDLVIVASEHKSGVNELKSSLPTDFYGLIIDTIEKGIPVILEVGDLDRSFASNAKDLMERCGVSFESNWVRIPPARMVMFPLVQNHPLFNEPNGSLSFSSVTKLWTTDVKRQYYDIGDLIKLTPGSNATLLLGTTANETQIHGTLTSCLDGMLLLQTFSSHQLTFNSMKLVWENYIYNQLRIRFLALR